MNAAAYCGSFFFNMQLCMALYYHLRVKFLSWQNTFLLHETFIIEHFGFLTKIFLSEDYTNSLIVFLRGFILLKTSFDKHQTNQPVRLTQQKEHVWASEFTKLFTNNSFHLINVYLISVLWEKDNTSHKNKNLFFLLIIQELFSGTV